MAEGAFHTSMEVLMPGNRTPAPPDPRDELLDLARSVIRNIEWSGPGGRCPKCHWLPAVGHRPDCPIGRVLAG